MTAVDCWLEVNGERFADTGEDLEGGTPTVLAELSVTWGRSTTVDQPEPASCRFIVHDRAGANDFLEVLDVGATVGVWASGDISTGTATDVAVDGGFETLPLGPVADRVTPTSTSSAWTTTTAVSSPTAAGVRSVAVGGTTVAPNNSRLAQIPPAPFSSDPTAWDGIGRFRTGQTWSWSLAVWSARDARTPARVLGMVFDGPLDRDGVLATGTQANATAPGGTWETLTGTSTAGTVDDDKWLGLRVTFTLAVWDSTAGTWAEKPGTWAEYGATYVDNQRLYAPPSELARNVLVFSGRVSDLTAAIEDRDGTLRVEATAVDQLADLQNRYVGDTPWPSQTVAQRFAAIIAASGADVDTRLDAPLNSLMVSRRDVDNQPAGSLLAELSQGVDGVLWSATHATTGPYLWLENVANRAAVGTLTLSGGVVVIVPASSGERPAGRTELDGCDLPAANVRWIRDVTDVITRVDATWLDQSTTPDVTERTVSVKDAPAEITYGVRRYGLSTPLINATDATTTANRVLARARFDDWRVDGLEYDLGLTPPAAGAETAHALDLLDGTIRLGRPVVIDDVTYWPAGDVIGFFLDGGSYTFDGVGWRLGMAGSPSAGMGKSGGWATLDPTWTWEQMSPTIAWIDLWGVTGPVAP